MKKLDDGQIKKIADLFMQDMQIFEEHLDISKRSTGQMIKVDLVFLQELLNEAYSSGFVDGYKKAND